MKLGLEFIKGLAHRYRTFVIRSQSSQYISYVLRSDTGVGVSIAIADIENWLLLQKSGPYDGFYSDREILFELLQEYIDSGQLECRLLSDDDAGPVFDLDDVLRRDHHLLRFVTPAHAYMREPQRGEVRIE